MKSKTIWFRAKKYGWGWTPCTWQGWLVTLAYVVYQLFLVAFIGNSFNDRAGVTSFIFLSLLGVILLIIIAYKFGEEPRWRWGK